MTAVIDHPSAGAEPDEAHRGPSYWREVVATVLLSLATLGSTWSAYQAALWSSHQATRFSEASTARTRSEGAATRAVQLTALDAGMFIEYAMALGEHRDQVARFLFKRFRPEMKVAVDAWLSTRPRAIRSEEHTSELQSPVHLVCRLLLEKKKLTTQHAW